jgi:hypothetical protein
MGMFPTLFQSTAFGIVQMVTNSLTAFAPQIAAMNHPGPAVFIGVSAIGGYMCANSLPRPKQVE